MYIHLIKKYSTKKEENIELEIGQIMQYRKKIRMTTSLVKESLNTHIF